MYVSDKGCGVTAASLYRKQFYIKWISLSQRLLQTTFGYNISPHKTELYQFKINEGVNKTNRLRLKSK